LGVHSSGGDMDTLCVGPKHGTLLRLCFVVSLLLLLPSLIQPVNQIADRVSFFNDFKDKLTAHPRIVDVAAVPDAYVPVLKCKFDGIEMDIVYAHLQHLQVCSSVVTSDHECAVALFTMILCLLYQ
jgi:poly(A) polymerase